jgi:hypothetical protein
LFLIVFYFLILICFLHSSSLYFLISSCSHSYLLGLFPHCALFYHFFMLSFSSYFFFLSSMFIFHHVTLSYSWFFSLFFQFALLVWVVRIIIRWVFLILGFSFPQFLHISYHLYAIILLFIHFLILIFLFSYSCSLYLLLIHHFFHKSS